MLRRFLPARFRYTHVPSTKRSKRHHRNRRLPELREILYIGAYLLQLLYYLWSVPFRVGFIYDPYVSNESIDAVVLSYIILDVIADGFGFVNFYFFVSARAFPMSTRNTRESRRDSTVSSVPKMAPLAAAAVRPTHHAARLGAGLVANVPSTLTALGRPSVDVTAAMGGGRSDDDRGAAVSFRHL
ncbi:hypothetical protein As57867_006406, partial [Aphanomyces stellatus]